MSANLNVVKITQKEIQEYKKMRKRQWRDQVWWDFIRSAKSEAIGYALDNKNFDDSLSDIQRGAEAYINGGK